MRVLAAVALFAAVGAAKDLYGNPRPFGPEQAAYPANCAVSPDGKWVAFMCGAADSLSIWSLPDGKKVWSRQYKCGTHRIEFSTKSDWAGCIVNDGYATARLKDGKWDLYSVNKIGFKYKIDKKVSPSPVALDSDADVHFVHAGIRYQAGTDLAPSTWGSRDKVALHTGRIPLGMVWTFRDPLRSELFYGSSRQLTIPGIIFAGSPDKRYVLAAMNKTFEKSKAVLKIYDRDQHLEVTGKLNVFRGKNRPLVEACYSPDSKLLLTVEGKGHVALRDPAKGKLKQRIVYKKGYAVSAAFSADGKHLITCGTLVGEPGVLIWDRK